MAEALKGLGKEEARRLLRTCQPGTRILLQNGEEAIFKKMAKVKFSGEINGESFSIPMSWVVKILEKAKPNEGWQGLEDGDLFYYDPNQKGNAILLVYLGREENKRGSFLIGKCPLSNTQWTVHTSFYRGKIKGAKDLIVN